ncbi:MAG TPA: hypothetical protein ENG98_02220 [Actinobacteria bacterium]|nr:preprotein translocase subunit SecA [bacterium BMS3Bbin02]HDL41815.1 hypothetical protein [Actinomycetota bacterium]
MDLHRGALARIDRKLLAGLSQDEEFQMVRVPVAPAKWSTWRRYCDAAGISMGRAIVTLIDRELIGVFGDKGVDDSPVFAQRAEHQLAGRETQVAARESRVEDTQKRLRRWSENLRLLQTELEAREQRTKLASKLAARPPGAGRKVGRNERCPCQSGLKYKHCHGLPKRQDSPPPT